MAELGTLTPAEIKAYIDAVVAATTAVNGINGKSAYQLDVEQGFVGTEEEWLASLKNLAALDGGAADSVYTPSDVVDGGNASGR